MLTPWEQRLVLVVEARSRSEEEISDSERWVASRFT
jgi:hypothetical protein